ncbi:MAG: hypothetical protein JSS82_10760 [Bacteroidetes bacterium]|nr:hypothetical protein [Bacteroidota bacterium]
MDTKFTIGDLITALKTDIFPDNSDNPLEERARKWELATKECITVCHTILIQHVTKPGLDDTKLSRWKRDKIEKCMKALSEYTEILGRSLTKERIEVNCMRGLARIYTEFSPDYIFIISNSYYGAILADIYWISDITIQDALLIAGGKLDISELGAKTPYIINHIEELLAKNKDVFKIYDLYTDTISEAFKCYKNGYHKAFNLLLLTSIEGLTRRLGVYLIKKQNLDVDPYADEYNSLDSFLRKIEWKEDLQISSTRLEALTARHQPVSFDDPFFDVKKFYEDKYITVKTRLDFLRRRFKENRDLILHGQEMEYNKPHHGYINSWALYEVLLAITEFYELYGNE